MSKFLDRDGLQLVWNKVSQLVHFSLDVAGEELDKKTDNFQIEKIKDYLYETYYDDINYEYAKDYFETRSPEIRPSACSSFRVGNYYARNFDWYYNNDAEFVVKTKARKGRHAVLGVASDIPGLTEEVAATGEWDPAYKILPFLLVDGINDKGVVCNINVVPLDNAIGDLFNSTVAYAGVEEKEKICNRMIVRYILDNFSTAREAVNYIRDYVTVYTPQSLIDKTYGLHVMVSDETENYILETIDGTSYITKVNADGTYEGTNEEYHDFLLKYPAMTNFYMAYSSPEAENDGKFYTQANELDEVYKNSLSPLGSGIERYNVMVDLLRQDRVSEYQVIDTITNKLKYTNAYAYLSDESKANDIWYSEYVGPVLDENGQQKLNEWEEPIFVTNATDPEDENMRSATGIASLAYLNTRVRTPEEADYSQKKFYGTWHTAHSSIYNIADRTLKLYNQEQPDQTYWEGEMYYTQKEINDLLKNVNMQS